MKNYSFLFSGILLIGFSLTSLAETYTYPQLVKRLTDLPELAKLPPPGEKTGLTSSYDRRSVYDNVKDKYINWGSNADWATAFARRETKLSWPTSRDRAAFGAHGWPPPAPGM